MKKFIIILASLVTLLLLAAVFIPILFRDEIQKAVSKTLNEQLEASVYFDPSQLGISLFKSFPDPTITLNEFGIVGQNEFEGDTLLSVGSFNITINLFSLFGDNYLVNSINLVRPRCMFKILDDGSANYNIYKESEPETGEEEAAGASSFNLSIESWKITDGYVRYLDNTSQMDVIVENINHTGSGDISSDIYDLKTQTEAVIRKLEYDRINYLSGQRINANATLNINLVDYKFTFNDNSLLINDFPVSFDGWLAMPSDDIEMDISFATSSSDVKRLFSLIPGAYTQEYAGIETGGEMAFSGYVRGTYNERSMPAYSLRVTTKDGMISYPDLPAPINNINLDMQIECADGVIENTSIDFRNLHFDLGNNPFDGTLVIHNLRDYRLEADMNAKLNLEELSAIFPMEGLDMKGSFSLNIEASGVYDSLQQKIPSIKGKMALVKGYIKSSELPKAVENFSFQANMESSGSMESFNLDVHDLSLALGQESIRGNMRLINLADPEWDLDVEGALDLQVLSDFYPVEGMSYEGLLRADIETKGKYSDVETERYDRLPTRGTVQLSDFRFASADLPQGMEIQESSISMDPQELKVNSFKGAIGKSDLLMEGNLTNYIEYVFQENSLLKGNFNLRSDVLDINEWMQEEPAEETETTDSVQMEVVSIPRNVDFELNSTVNNIYYDNLHLTNAKGKLLIRDGILDMSGLSFDLLGGNVVMNGTYNTQIPDKPYFNYNLDITSLSLPSAFASFSTVRTFAPVAKHMNGTFSTSFDIRGFLKKDMSPVYESLLGSGLIRIAEAQVKDSQLAAGVSKFIKSDLSSGQLALKDVIMKASIENGRAHVAPFDLLVGGQKATISGSIGADGSLDYLLNTEVEAGIVGQQVNQMLAALKGEGGGASSSRVKLNFNISGTYDQPSITLAGTPGADAPAETAKATVEREVKAEVAEKVDATKKQAEEQITQETKKLIEEGEERIQPEVDSLKKTITKSLEDEAAEVISEELDSTANELKKSLQNLFKKKKKN